MDNLQFFLQQTADDYCVDVRIVEKLYSENPDTMYSELEKIITQRRHNADYTERETPSKEQNDEPTRDC